ncbi:HAD hydrolase-like protein [Leucobacter allii]|uniref:HAD family hydrolase n=1 Tax=Leucobacter allii TaxID=2932247 RepID=UPI001FD3FC72|nr:HAD family hydrolase [Leucobacter allii]UOR02215.1 HAD hydrolase-like protein [Leucobacter allii]
MIALAVFDMAGTTIDDGGAVYRALEQAVVETGVPVAAEDLQRWMGAEKRAAITALIELGGGDPTEPADAVDRAFARFRALLAERYAAEPPTPIAGVPEAITALRDAGVRVALTTGFSREVAEGILRELDWSVGGDGGAEDRGGDGGEPALRIGEPALRIDALVCGDEVVAGRPAPYMIHRAMERTGVLDVAEVVVAGDTVVDVQAGAHSGAAASYGVLTGKLDRADFVGQPATDLLESVAEIPARIARLG